MNRYFSSIKLRKTAAFPLTFILLLLGLTACADVSPAIGKFYTGRTLHVSVVAMERAPELIYTLPKETEVPKYYRVSPEEAGNELLLMRIKVQNHTATSAIVDIDQNAAELRDFFHDKYFPFNVNDRAEEISQPEDISRQRVARCPISEREPRNLCFLWNTSYTDGSVRAFELIQGYGIDGWLLFEIPRDVEIRELRWRAGDGLTIEF